MTFNSIRVQKLIVEAIARLELDLSGLTILTEAASGSFVVTPLIAAAAGADRVIALTRDSVYGRADDIAEETMRLANQWHLSDRLEIHCRRDLSLFSEADIVTNLGFVRPLDAEVISAMKPSAVIPLMFEAWEFRPEDIDLDACRARGISVWGTNENHPRVDVFRYAGVLCCKMLLESGLEISGNRIVVLSQDNFGCVIKQFLKMMGAEVLLLPLLASVDSLKDADALVCADYTATSVLVGEGSAVTGEELQRSMPGITVMQYSGHVNVKDLLHHHVRVFPGKELPPGRMMRTLADLGPKPVIDLHAAGFKVADMAARSDPESLASGCFCDLPQPVI